IRPGRVDVGVVRAKPAVEVRMPGWWRLRVALARARQPPPADPDRARRPAHVHDAVGLIVPPIARGEVRCAAGAMRGRAVHEPQMMYAARGGTGRIEERDGAWTAGIRDVVDLESGRLRSSQARLVGDDEEIAHQIERVRSHLAMREVRLEDHLRRARIADVDRGHILRRRLMSEPQYAAAVPRDLDDHALAAVAEAAEIVMGEEPHLQGWIGWTDDDLPRHRRKGGAPVGRPSWSVSLRYATSEQEPRAGGRSLP